MASVPPARHLPRAKDLADARLLRAARRRRAGRRCRPLAGALQPRVSPRVRRVAARIASSPAAWIGQRRAAHHRSLRRRDIVRSRVGSPERLASSPPAQRAPTARRRRAYRAAFPPAADQPCSAVGATRASNAAHFDRRPACAPAHAARRLLRRRGATTMIPIATPSFGAHDQDAARALRPRSWAWSVRADVDPSRNGRLSAGSPLVPLATARRFDRADGRPGASR